MLAVELHRLRIEQQVHERAILEEVADRVGGLAVLREKAIEVLMDRVDHVVEVFTVGGVTGSGPLGSRKGAAGWFRLRSRFPSRR